MEDSQSSFFYINFSAFVKINLIIIRRGNNLLKMAMWLLM